MVSGRRDIQWIRGALQTAVAIEHATMPVYAAAMYSLEVQNYPAYNVLRSVLMEEMLHMAAAANMVAALGGRPRIGSLDPTQLRTGLPAGIAPGLTARCARLSRRQLDTFMRIEAPRELVPQPEAEEVGYPTIGAFYEAIASAIVANADSVIAAVNGPQRANQVGGNLGYACIDPLATTDVIEQFVAGIELIREQGEGAETTRSAGAASASELSHYARFAELRFGRRYSGPRGAEQPVPHEGQRRWFTGESIAWPTVINMLAVPADGYAQLLARDPDGGEVRKDLDAFDDSYTRMLQALDDCWNGPVESGWPALGRAVYEMNELRVTSCFRILRHQVPADLIDKVARIYPDEAADLSQLTALDEPVFYGPRFRNTRAA